MLDRISVSVDDLGDRQSLLGLMTLSVVVFKIAGTQLTWDKKLLRKLLDLHQQVILVPSTRIPSQNAWHRHSCSICTTYWFIGRLALSRPEKTSPTYASTSNL